MSSAASSTLALRASAALCPAAGAPVRMRMGGVQASFHRVALGDGIAFVYYQVRVPEPTAVQVFDDGGDIHLSFLLRGGVQARVQGSVGAQVWTSAPSTVTLSHTPQRQISMRYLEACAGLRLLATRETLAAIDARWEDSFSHDLDEGTLVRGWPGIAPLHTLSDALVRSLAHDPLGLWHQSLWRQAKACEFLALAAPQATMPGDSTPWALRAQVQLRLRRARDLLLADLACAPSLRSLANECGMGLTNFKRDFKRMFGVSAFALFQRQRMTEARRLMEEQGYSVSEAAMALGYANFSQFAAAFRLAHGLRPREVTRSRRR